MERSEIPELPNGGATCQACRHARVVMNADLVTSRTLCLRYPPTVFGGIVPTGNGKAAAISDVNYVVIGAPSDSWCGEFAAKMH